MRVRHIARNVLFNWIGTVANLAVGFFLSPFILHRLGDIAYGVWVLAVSTVAYLSLLDLGMQSSVLRFVSKGHTQGDHESASAALSAALWVRLRISGLVLLLSFSLAALFPTLFKIPGSLAADARIAVITIGFTMALSMSVGVASGVLSGLNRYDLQNYVTLLQTAIRVTGVVLLLRSGHGIVAIALCELFATCVGLVLLIILARRLYPQLTLSFRRPRRETLRMVWSYSAYAFLTTVAVQLVYQSDNLVVGAFVSASAVTFYAIANSLCRYATQIVGSIAGTFVPAASTYEAAGDTEALVNLYIYGTRATLVISLPILATFLLRGHRFIQLWMGPEYAGSSGDILILLTVPLLFAYANRTASSIAYGVEKHKLTAIWAIIEGVANLILSITLVHFYGLYGVALGTLIPSVIVHLGFWPWYTSKLVNIGISEVIWRVWGPIFLAIIPFALISYAFERALPPHHMATFFLQVLATLPVFFLTLAIFFRNYIRGPLYDKCRGLLARAQ
ncbi:MAG TPA: oligosaccharide flippase family protein [Acidobacteriaceae bacterium]|nr:oligosaccharide flippase family protein [Acidobacteriaceae bacterium]